MDSIIEVVFENIEKNSVKKILNFFIDRSFAIISVSCSEQLDISENNIFISSGLNCFLELNTDASVFIEVKTMILKEIVFPKVLIRIVKYENKYDIDFSFNCSELQNATNLKVVNALHSCALEISCNYDVERIYGGMEPASDASTRFFTNDKLGPLIP